MVVARWIAKRHLIFHGTGIPKAKHNEDILAIWEKIVYDKWGIRIDRKDIPQIHRLGDGILVLCTELKKGSLHDRFLSVKNDKKPG